MRNRKLHVSPVGSNPEQILRQAQATARSAPINDAETAAQLASLRVIDFWQPASAQSTEKEIASQIKEQKDFPAWHDEYLSATETLYASHVEVQKMTVALQVFENTGLQRPIEDAVEDKIGHLFNKGDEKALTGSFNPLYQVVKQSAAKAFYTGGADHVPTKKLRNLADSQAYNQNVTLQLMKSPKFSAPMTRLVIQHAELAKAR